MKLLHLFVALLTATLFLACSSDKESLQVETNLTTNSEDIVELQARGALAYTWRQLSGTPVILINANTATPSFIAPDVVTQETLVFELEAVTAQIQGESITLTKQVSVVVQPKASLEDSTDTGSTLPEQEQADEQEEENNTAESNDTLPDSTEVEQVAQGEEQEQIHETNTTTSETNSTTTQETNSTTQTTPTSKTQTSVALKSLKLTLEKNSLNVDTNTTLKVVATYSDNTTKDVTTQVAWNLSDATAVQITQKSLHAKKDTNIFLQAKLGTVSSNTLALEIYKEINGHRLPPEPDETLNNSTLLGIDVNNNGIRDDVERKIYETYDKKVNQKLMMQSAKTDQAMLADPDLIKNAYDWQEPENKNFGCRYYLYHEYNITLDSNYVDFIEDNTYNTEERIRKYMRYNNALSGGVFGTPPSYEVESSCDFNVTEALGL